jgi:hypothetical protein
MANKIEIFENTLLKLLVRRGMDADRQKIVLSEGELGYTTDTNRLYVGDGQTTGGILVGGNKFLGSVVNVTTLAGAAVNDIAYSSNTDKLYYFKGGDYTDISNWEVVGGTYEPGNNTITIGSTNDITVGTISATNITRDLVSDNIVLNTTNRISLSSNIQIDSIRGLNSSSIELPVNLRIGDISYQWPSGGVPNNSYLKSDISGNLSWNNYIDVETTNFVYNSAGIIPVGSIMPFISSANAPTGWLLCNGQSVLGTAYSELSAVIGTSFGGDGTSFNVPNLINKTLYGVNNLPGSSTLYGVSSGTNSLLSATGALYIIKAKPDGVARVSMSVSSPLCASVNGTQQGGSFNPLSGIVSIGLTTTSLTADTTILGGFVADRYGRVLRTVDDPSPPPFDPGPGTRPTYNGGISPIAFFRTPAYILYQGYTTASTSYRFTMSAYPFITDNTGVRVGSGTFYSVPPTAKNLIVDTSIYKRGPDAGNIERILASAPNISLVEDVSLRTLGNNEFLIGVNRADGAGDSVQNSTQCIIPLSATPTGHLVAAFRASASVNDAYWIRVVGYTL